MEMKNGSASAPMLNAIVIFPLDDEDDEDAAVVVVDAEVLPQAAAIAATARPPRAILNLLDFSGNAILLYPFIVFTLLPHRVASIEYTHWLSSTRK